jgi:ABC-2 type transport system ATP-binding protein
MIVEINSLSHSYPPVHKQKEPRVALKDISLSVKEGEIFCLLGPNGSGKSTLFKILSTLIPVQSGSVNMFGLNLAQHEREIRKKIGVVFQSPSVDKALTARENLLHQGHLYGLSGAHLRSRIDETLKQVGILDRAHDLVSSLSGGIQRRVELAKSLLHSPPVLLLDEPSTGLDPGARREFEATLHHLRDQFGVTILLTTHILDESENCNRLAIFDEGKLVSMGSPAELTGEIGGDVIAVSSSDPARLAQEIKQAFGDESQVVDSVIRVERKNGAEFIPQLAQRFPGLIQSIMLSKPTLEDVFIRKTGHKFWTEA